MLSRRLHRLGACATGVLLLALCMAWGGRRIEAAAPDTAVSVSAVRGRPAASVPPAPVPGHEVFGHEVLGDEVPGDEASVAARAVDEESFEAVPRGRASGWQRTAPRPPLGPSSLTPQAAETAPLEPSAPDPGLPRRTLLFNPVVTAAGRIAVAGHVIDLEGVRVVDPALRCRGRAAPFWPCGVVARAAFRSWVRGRAVMCVVAPVPLPKPVRSVCHLGGRDMGEWLVSNGFAEALPGGAYEQAGKQAQATNRGVFGSRPRPLALSAASPAEGLEQPASAPLPAAGDP